MKKLLVLITTFLVFSCSTSEDSDSTNLDSDPIIGSWHPVKVVQYTSDGEEMVHLINECEQKTTFTFSPEGDMESISYEVVDEKCQLIEPNDQVSVKWERLAEGTYRFIEEQVNLDGEKYIDITTPEKVSFPDENTMVMIMNGEYGDLDDVDIEYHIQTFRRD